MPEEKEVKKEPEAKPQEPKVRWWTKALNGVGEALGQWKFGQ